MIRIRIHNSRHIHLKSVLRIRDVYPGSRIRIFDPGVQGQKDYGSKIRIRIKELRHF
jgi:hypothetical protein